MQMTSLCLETPRLRDQNARSGCDTDGCSVRRGGRPGRKAAAEQVQSDRRVKNKLREETANLCRALTAPRQEDGAGAPWAPRTQRSVSPAPPPVLVLMVPDFRSLGCPRTRAPTEESR